MTTVPSLATDPSRFAPPSHPDSAGADAAIPLVVDVDGTLVAGDLLWEGTVQLWARRPESIPGFCRAAIRGIAPLKEFVASTGGISSDTIPLDESTMLLIAEARRTGRRIVLASGAHESHVARLGDRVGAEQAWGSCSEQSLTGRTKLGRIQAAFPQFDYVGNASADIPLWRAARRAYAVNASSITLWRARRVRPDIEVLQSGRGSWRQALAGLRPHQWSKNVLLFLPALAAHVAWSATNIGRLALGFAAFSALASAVYLLNDVLDAPHDRLHPVKRRRPIASGHLSIPGALGVAAGLVGFATVLALLLPPAFGVVLAGYLVATTAYSLLLKTKPLIDVVTLAILYASRLAAGAALVDVPLSGWFLAFSMFFFLSLALSKRVIELRDQPPGEGGVTGSRGYMAADLPMLSSLGIAATASSALVYCLYVTDESVVQLYTRPDVLWLGLPILLYWQARVWLWTGRGWMSEDPVVFALKDRKSHLLFVLFLLVMVLAV